jgi:non-heme chloroperoxidase
VAKRLVEHNGVSYEIAYDILNNSATQTMVFLHGWGSNKTLMKQAFGSHFNHFKHLYIDMPGFGDTQNSTVLTTADYATIIQRFFTQLGLQPHYIFGHSFGGKVATLIQPPHLVLLSSAGIIEPKPFNVRFKIALFKLLKPLGGQKLWRWFASSDANQMDHAMYETMKKVVNEDFLPTFQSYQGECTIFWGKEDTATSLHSGEAIAHAIQGSRFFPFVGDHYFFLQQANAIEKALLNP